MIQVVLHSDGKGVTKDLGIDQIGEILAKNQATVWIDVAAPTPEEIKRVAAEFGFHPLSVEDMIRGGQRPKIEQYDNYQFIVFYGLSMEDDRLVTHEVDISLGKHYIVTVHSGRCSAIAETAARWRANVAKIDNHGPGFLLYSVLDALVDGYFPVLDDISDRAESLEESIILHNQPALQAQILQLRRDLLMIRRAAGPERDVMNVLLRHDPPQFSRQELIYFQDVYDHLLRITDSVDIYRDILSSVLDANLSMTSYTLNVVVKRLTSFSIMLMSITLFAGIFGMNFDSLPWRDWAWGFSVSLLLMAALGLGEFAIFRRIGWL